MLLCLIKQETTAKFGYYLVGGNNKFAVNQLTGDITVNGSLDREMKDTYTLTVSNLVILISPNLVLVSNSLINFYCKCNSCRICIIVLSIYNATDPSILVRTICREVKYSNSQLPVVTGFYSETEASTKRILNICKLKNILISVRLQLSLFCNYYYNRYINAHYH